MGDFLKLGVNGTQAAQAIMANMMHMQIFHRLLFIRFDNGVELTLIHWIKRNKVFSPHLCTLPVISASFQALVAG